MSTHTYSSYLEIDKLLSAQRSMTDSDDELLFIVIHQAHELWFKLAIHELGCAIEALHRERPSNSDCIIAFKRLSRVSEIQRVLIASWEVLTTLTPDEFHVFRRTVGQNGASGFQSIQYRVLEFKLGLKYCTVRFEKPVEDGYQTVEIDVFANARTDDDRERDGVGAHGCHYACPGTAKGLIPGTLQVEIGRAEHRIPHIPKLRVHRVVEELVGGLTKISEAGRAAGSGAVADHPGDRGHMGKAPPPKCVLEIDQFFAELIQLRLVLAIFVNVFPCVEHRQLFPVGLCVF